MAGKETSGAIPSIGTKNPGLRQGAANGSINRELSPAPKKFYDRVRSTAAKSGAPAPLFIGWPNRSRATGLWKEKQYRALALALPKDVHAGNARAGLPLSDSEKGNCSSLKVSDVEP